MPRAEDTSSPTRWLTTYRAVYMLVVECYGVVARVVEGDPDDLSAVEAKGRWR